MSERRQAALVALALCLRAGVAAGANYSRIEGGARCWDYRIDDIASSDVCFNAAATELGLSGATKLQVNGIGFNGCAYNSASGVLIFSVSPSATPDTNSAVASLEYLCDGIATTTTTTTQTWTTATSTTSTGLFSLLEGGSRCWDYSISDISSKDACFNTALHFVGLSGVATAELNNFGFSGCVYNTVANILMYGVTPGLAAAENMVQSSFRYVCDGIPTTTTTATTTTVSTTTQTIITSTLTTLTTTTSKVYSQLSGGSRCYDSSLTDVVTQEECFGAAAAAVGMAGKTTMVLNSFGFTGCLYNSGADAVLFGTDSGATPATNAVQPSWEYICIGVVKSLFPFPIGR